MIKFIGWLILFTFWILVYYDVLNYGLFGGIADRIILLVFPLLIFFGLMFYDDIQRFFNRRRMKGKERTLNIIENSLLSYCLAKHAPHNIHYYYELGYEPLDNDAINDILNALNAELTKNGTAPDNELSEHGLQLEHLINEITEKYPSPEAE